MPLCVCVFAVRCGKVVSIAHFISFYHSIGIKIKVNRRDRLGRTSESRTTQFWAMKIDYFTQLTFDRNDWPPTPPPHTVSRRSFRRCDGLCVCSCYTDTILIIHTIKQFCGCRRVMSVCWMILLSTYATRITNVTTNCVNWRGTSASNMLW